ncbi:hypothetical protein [Rhizobium gallicum]|nr:hypothetical protein [Rhizobium gallicum]
MSNVLPMKDQHPQTLQELKQFIAEGRILLSYQLEQVARQMLEQPN